MLREEQILAILDTTFQEIKVTNRDEIDLINAIYATLEAKLEAMESKKLYKNKSITRQKLIFSHEKCKDYYNYILTLSQNDITIEFISKLVKIYSGLNEEDTHSTMALDFLIFIDSITQGMLHKAVRNSDVEKVVKIIGTMQNPHVFINHLNNSFKGTLLHLAMQTFALLLKGYEQADHPTKLALYNQSKIIELFSKNGADFSSKNEEGKTCYDHFISNLPHETSDINSIKIKEKLNILVERIGTFNSKQSLLLEGMLKDAGYNVSKGSFLAKEATKERGRSSSFHRKIPNKSPLSFEDAVISERSELGKNLQK